MSQPVLIKVYGNIYPADETFVHRLEDVCANAIGQNDKIVSHDNGLVRISFEGIYFPVEETLALLEKNLRPEQAGKLDVLDLENWTLHRHIFEAGRIISKNAPLNNVLAYSGH